MIMVVGSTGIVGGMITGRLLEDSKEVRILVRTNSPSEQMVREGRATSAEELMEAGAQLVYGNLRDRASLDAAVQGVGAVIGPDGGLPEGSPRPSLRAELRMEIKFETG